jgi:hypothetical protein
LLDAIQVNNLEICATYAKHQDLLDTLGGNHSNWFATRVEEFQGLLDQDCLRCFKHSPVFKSECQLPHDPNKAVAIDKSNGNSNWQDDKSFERGKLCEHNIFIAKQEDLVHSNQVSNAPEEYKNILIHMVYNVKHDGRHISHDMITVHSVTGVLCLINIRHNSLSYPQVCKAIPDDVTYALKILSGEILSGENKDDVLSKFWNFLQMWPLVNLLLFGKGDKSNCEARTSIASRQADGECYGTLPCGMSLGQFPLGKESLSVSQSNGRSGYVSHMEFVSALLRKSTIFELPCCGLPPCDMSCGNYPLNTDVASVNQNYAHGVKEARTEVIPKPCSVTTWTRNNRSVCTIAMFLEAHVFSLYLSVYKTKVQ